MPQIVIDYSNTIIYKITCKDTAINETYVGHTTNFVQRKHSHKQSCTNEKSMNYNCKLYKTIRANGGWDNWDMNIITFFKCNDHYEARIKEQEYFILLNATLNSIEPFPKPKPKEHKIDKQYEEQPRMNKSSKATKIYLCETCDYTCSKKSDYDKHLLTTKHQNRKNLNVLEQNYKKYICTNCNKNYTARNSLWYHQKKCKTENNVNENMYNSIIDKELIVMLIKQNAELAKETIEYKNMVMKVIENVRPTNNTQENHS